MESIIEKCVISSANTPYRFSTPISHREFYAEGLRQSCQHFPMTPTSRKLGD